MRYGQGRPFHDGLILLFSFLGLKLGGLRVVYWVAYIIVTINSFLFYTLLKRLSKHQIFAVTGALAFCLFPADTTRAFLTHSFGVQPSLTFLLLAINCYISGNKKLSYLVILGSLLCYETFFPVFLAAPLLEKKWDLRLKRELFRHALILGVLIVCVVIIRKVTGEPHVAAFDIQKAMQMAVRQMLIGPTVSMRMFLYRSQKTILKLNEELIVFLLPCLVGLAWILSQLKLFASGDSLRLKVRWFLNLEVPDFFQDLAKLMVSGLIMLILAYPLALTVSATQINGRPTRVHSAAIVGASILCSCLCSAILLSASAYGKKRLATVSLGTFFTVLVGFGLIVQQDYRLSWKYQRAFWTDVMELCPDITDGTIILIEHTILRNPIHLDAFNTSIFSTILNGIYQFPDNWENIPRLYKLREKWQEMIVYDENGFNLNDSWIFLTLHPPKCFPLKSPPAQITTKSSNIILLESKNGRLIRRNKPLVIEGQEFRLKERSASMLSSFEKGILYNYLIVNSDEKPIRYIN